MPQHKRILPSNRTAKCTGLFCSFFTYTDEEGFRMTRKKLLNAVLVAALGVGMSAIGTSAHDWGQGPPKYLIAWMSDQYMDGRNASPLDGILGLPSGALPDADCLAVLDANPHSPTYGQVINTAE